MSISERFGVGQNLYIYKQTIRAADTDWTRAIKDWYEEVTLFSKKHVKPFRSVGSRRRTRRTSPAMPVSS